MKEGERGKGMAKWKDKRREETGRGGKMVMEFRKIRR